MERSILTRMAAALAHRGGGGACSLVEAAVGLGIRERASSAPGAAAPGPLHHGPSGVVVVADARIDNRRELGDLLRIPPAHQAGDDELILRAYLRWGVECADRLVGDFAFVIWDRRERTLFCARDPMGVKPLYYFVSAEVFAFATEARALHSLPEVPREVNAEQVATHLAWTQPDRESTIFQGVRRLPAAHSLTVEAGGALAPRRYWSIDVARDSGCATADQYVERMRELFTEAVRCRLPSGAPVATALSGGLDSSAITCTARLLRDENPGLDVHAISLIFPDLAADDLRLIDERRHIEQVTAAGGLTWHPVRGDQISPLHDIDRVLWHVDEPFAAPNLYLHWGLYRAASAAGARVFLDGLDGDVTVSHGYGRLNSLLRTGDWREFEREVKAFGENRGMGAGGVLAHFGLPYLDDLAARRQWRAWKRAAGEMTRRFGVSRRDVLLKHGLLPLIPSPIRAAMHGDRRHAGLEILHPRLAEYVRSRGAGDADAPVAEERESHIEGLSQPAYQATLEIADRCAATFGVEPRYPFFDRRLMEFCVAVPPELKFAGGWTRLIFRRAMEGVLPPEIQWRSTKANLSPNFQRQFRARDRAMVESADLRVLEPYADVSRLASIRDRYFADPGRGWGDADSYLLFRAASFCLWYGEGRHATPDALAA